MLNIVGVETTILATTRLSLFFACRNYLLRILYSNLATLSTPSASAPPSNTHSRSSSPIPGNELGSFELETLPPPTTQSPRSSRLGPRDASYLHTSLSRQIFALVFAESCMLFLLLMLQGWGIFSPRSRLLNWRFSLIFLVCCILVVIPLAFGILLTLPTTTRNSRTPLISLRTILALMTITLYLFAISYIPVPPSLQPTGTFTAYLSRLIVIGTVILGGLSGFGAISSSWQFLPTSDQQVTPSEQDLDTAQYALTSVRNDIRQRRSEAARREGTTSGGSLLSRVSSSFHGNPLAQELQGLEALEYQMSRNLESLKERYDREKFRGTLKGMVSDAFGRIISVYSIIRIASSVYNLIFVSDRRTPSSPTYPDFFTNFFFLLYSHLWSGKHSTAHLQYESLAAVARQISLLMVGMIIVSSLRMVLKGVTRALRITNRNLSASLLLLLLAQIMAIYLLSTLVQLRSSFPPTSSPEEASVNLFTTIPEYEVFGSLFDWSFLLAVGASCVVRWTLERIT